MCGTKVRSAFAKPELIAGVVCLLVLVVLWLSFLLARVRSGPNSLRDKTQIQQIHAAMLVFAGEHSGRLPTPGLFGGFDADRPEHLQGAATHDFSQNHSGFLYSSLVSMGYFNTEILVSPNEVNPFVREYVDYNFDTYDPLSGHYWDPRFNVDLTQDSKNGANASYAHLSLCGDRWLKHWRTDAPPATPILGRRGTKNGEYDTENFYRSPTLKLHGPQNQWVGNLVFADNHTGTLSSFFPREVGFRVEGDDRLVKDNIFAAEFVHPDGNEAATDAWLSLSIGSTAVTVDEIFDPLRP